MKVEKLFHDSWPREVPEAILIFRKKILPFLKERIKDGEVVFPSINKMFRAFRETPFDKVRVVILGQDPYHDGSANGLCFDNSPKGKMSPSLRNILDKIIKSDVKKTNIKDLVDKSGSYLGHLPSQGVLMINSAFSVAQGEPGSHSKKWKSFTSAIIEALAKRKEPIVWILWGAHALDLAGFKNPEHFYIVSSHPSPFSYDKQLREFPSFRSINSFEEANKILNKISEPINW